MKITDKAVQVLAAQLMEVQAQLAPLTTLETQIKQSIKDAVGSALFAAWEAGEKVIIPCTHGAVTVATRTPSQLTPAQANALGDLAKLESRDPIFKLTTSKAQGSAIDSAIFDALQKVVSAS